MIKGFKGMETTSYLQVRGTFTLRKEVMGSLFTQLFIWNNGKKRKSKSALSAGIMHMCAYIFHKGMAILELQPCEK
jgi:hypothetical protein